jgi:UDP-N-acetylmuramoylalanine--D-glutamate ligase
MGVTYVGGPDYLEGLADSQGAVIFRSPGIRPDREPLRRAVAAGAVLSSEMELFMELTEAVVLGVTGSDGKTTSTTLTSLFVSEALKAGSPATGAAPGHMYLGGNIGSPLLPLVDAMTAQDVAVVELSSFQLMTMTRSPYRAAVTNLAENHLNWHTDMAEYVSAKANILTHGPAGGGVLNADNPLTVRLGLSLPDSLPLIWFSSTRAGRAHVVPPERMARGCPDEAVYEADGWIVRESAKEQVPLLALSRIRLPGRHNLENYMTALSLSKGWVTPTIAGQVADNFTGVPHRLELVREVGGVRYYNSSIDSSPTRTAAALSAMADMNVRAQAAGEPPRRPPIVICGGRDKHLDLSPLAEALCRMAGAVVLTGEARELIRSALAACPLYDPDTLPVHVIPDWEEAMTAACRMARPGDTVLLSPACTSFDAFRNFEERGQRFREIVNRLP